MNFRLLIFFFSSLVFSSDVTLDSSSNSSSNLISSSSLISTLSDTKNDQKNFPVLMNDLFLHISNFLPVPQRELIGLSKSTDDILKDFPFHNLVSDRFQIYELRSATRDDDLIWFEDKYECFANYPDQFFIFLWHAIFIENMFSFNEKLLCQYFLRIFKSKKNIYDSIFKNEFFWHASSKLLSFFVDRNYYDLLISFCFQNLHLYSRNLNFFGFKFYQELIISNSENDILSNFFLLFDTLKTLDKKSHMMSKFLLTDKAEIILYESLNRDQSLNGNISFLIKNLFFYFFDKILDLKFSIYPMNSQELNRVYEQNLRILLSNSIDSADFENFKTLNEIYFGCKLDISNAVEFIGHYITSAVHFNKTELFLILLKSHPELCCYWIRENIDIFKNNLAFFFIFFEFFPDWNNDKNAVYSSFVFDEIFKLYNFKDFRIDIDNSCILMLELKEELLHLIKKNYPLTFIHKYNDKFIQYNTGSYFSKDIFGIFKGTGFLAEEAFIQIIQCFGRTNHDRSITYEFVSDDIFKLFSTSERITKFLFEINMNTKIFVKPVQLLRLLKDKVKLNHDSFKFKIFLIADDFDSFKKNIDFEIFEKFIGGSILFCVKNIISKDSDKPFSVYFKVRNALIYLLNGGKYLELLELDIRILSYLEKETGKSIQFLYDATIEKNNENIISEI